jgi:thioredoxin 2
VEAGDDDFAQIAEQSSMFVLVDLWATWCGPCRMVSPALEQLAKERAGQIKLVKVDIDTAPKLARRFEVQAVPTLMVMHHGKVIARQAGAAPVPVLRRWLDEAVSAKSHAKSDAKSDSTSANKE